MENSNAYLQQLQAEMKKMVESEKKPSGNNQRSREELLKKYFVPRNDSETFRILPPLGNSSKPIQEAFFHVATLNGPNGKKLHGKVIYCPAHNDPFEPKKDENGQIVTDKEGKPVMIPVHCPLCEKNKEILKTQDQSVRGKKKEDCNDAELIIWEKNREIFKVANEWTAKKFYIVRGIDKGKSGDGVKFWRFKKNFKNQGTFDKLIPVLNQFMEMYRVPYFDPENGSDLNITMSDAEFMGRTYKSITAIIPKPPSKLSSDSLIAQQWLNDKITWRDVFKKKTAPNITPIEYLEMVASGTDPYWDDTDTNNKKWVFPGRPDLEVKANTRDRDLGGEREENYNNFQQASDIQTGVGINNVTQKDVGTFENSGQPNAVDATAVVQTQPEAQTTTATVETNVSVSAGDDNSIDGDDYDDLPF